MSVHLVERAVELVKGRHFKSSLVNILNDLERQGTSPSDWAAIDFVVNSIDPHILDDLHEFYGHFALTREKQTSPLRTTIDDLEDIYDFGISTELSLLSELIGYSPKSITVVGSGYWPKTAIYLRALGVSVTCVDIDGDCFKQDCYAGFSTMTVDAAELSLTETDAVIVASTVGPRRASKTAVVRNLISQIGKTKSVLVREPVAEERLLFPETVPLATSKYRDTILVSCNEYCRRRIYY